MANGAHHVPDPMDHVLDAPHWEFFDRLFGEPVAWHLPGFQLFPSFDVRPFDLLGLHFPGYHFSGYFQLTKYMILELIAAFLIVAIFVPLARRARSGIHPRGPFWNAFEGVLTFIRDDVARPNLGEHNAEAFLPFLWTVFLFVLFCNLLGMFPWMGSPTANISVTGALAAVSFVLIHFIPIWRHGLGTYLKSMWISTGLPWYAELPISLMIVLIELMGTLIKSFVLAVRLFANMFAGHMVLAMILIFIVLVGNDGFSGLWPVVTVSSVLGVAALSLLELFVAFLQAYVFVFLTALFIGMGLHHAEEHAGHGEHGHAEHGQH